MIVLRFFVYGAVAFYVLAKCMLMPLETPLYVGIGGGVATALSCLAVLGIVHIYKELNSQ